MANKIKSTNYCGPMNWGYDELEDGTYKLAPMINDRMEKLLSDQNGLKVFVNNVNEYVSNRFSEIEKEKRKLWLEIYNNLGLKYAEYDLIWNCDQTLRKEKRQRQNVENLFKKILEGDDKPKGLASEA